MRTPGSPSAESDGSTLVPAVFERALAGLAAVELRPEFDREQLPAPRRLASYSHADSVAVLVAETSSGPGGARSGGGSVDIASMSSGSINNGGAELEEIGSGRFVLLYEPDGHPEWQGVFRCVTLIQVDLETEIAEDRLLPEVAWSWLTEAFEQRDARYAALGGTVSQCASTKFGGLASRTPADRYPAAAAQGGGPRTGGMPGSGQGGALAGGTFSAAAAAQASGNQALGNQAPGNQAPGNRAPSGWGADPGAGAAEPIEHSLELRASWTPLIEPGPRGRAIAPEDAYTAIQAHFRAWTDLLAAAAGLPPVLAGVSALPGGQRR